MTTEENVVVEAKQAETEPAQQLILETLPNSEWESKLNDMGQSHVIRVLDMTTVINGENEPLTTLLVLKSTKEFVQAQMDAQAASQAKAE